MTQPIQKSCERHFVEEAAKCLGKSWSLGPDREIPDFLVTEDDHQFGLEVCDIFIGEQNERGSVDKKREANTQRAINAVRLKYEKLVNIPLTVKFVGDLCAENMAKVVPALVERKLVSEPVGSPDCHRYRHRTACGTACICYERVPSCLDQRRGSCWVGGSQPHAAHR